MKANQCLKCECPIRKVLASNGGNVIMAICAYGEHLCQQVLYAANSVLLDLLGKVSKKASLYIAQCSVLRTFQSFLHFTFPTDLITRTPSRLLWEASSHMLQLMREGCSYTYPPLSIARYSFIQLRELEQCRVK